MKEVAIREYQGGTAATAFAKGVRDTTGRTRGRSVVVGTELRVADTGTLTVSSKRLVYLGSKKSMEFPFAKLLSFDVFNDGIRLHSSNRQTTRCSNSKAAMSSPRPSTRQYSATRGPPPLPTEAKDASAPLVEPCFPTPQPRPPLR
jgi:hypothetical protein